MLGIGDVVRVVVWLYLGLLVVLVGAALKFPRSGRRKALWASAVLLVLVGPLVYMRLQFSWERSERQERQAKAMAMWKERCQKAGEFIHQTVEDVEGVYLLKVRPKGVNFGNQFELDDPYGSDVSGMGVIETFLDKGSEPGKAPPSKVSGYRYVVAKDLGDGQLYRFTGNWVSTRKKDVTSPWIQAELKKNPNFDLNIYDFKLQKASAEPLPRYGVTWDDISTREEREHWIAGSSLKVIDLQTNKVIAERVGYMVDRAQGSKAGNRSPWMFAADTACPSFRFIQNAPRVSPDSHWQIGQTYRFVSKVLKPKQ